MILAMSDLHETQRALARDQIGHLGKNPPLRVETRGQKLDLARSTVEEKRTTEVEIQHEITSLSVWLILAETL